MITVALKPSSKTKNDKQALFVRFPYNAEIVQRVKSMPSRFYDPNSREWEVPTRYLDDLLRSLQEFEVKFEGEVTKFKKKLDQVVSVDKLEPIDPCVEHTFKTVPFRHQIEGFNYGLRHNKFLLADEQGLGKTAQSLNIALARKSQFKNCLIICCVNGNKFNWRKEVAIHTNEKAVVLDGPVKDRIARLKRGVDEFFIIINIESLRNKEMLATLQSMVQTRQIGMTIIDEFTRGVKNPTSTQGKAIHAIKTPYKIAITGTPVVNKPIDLFNTLKWLDIEHHSFTAFKSRYCILGGYGGYEVVGYKNLNELHATVKHGMLRRTKDQVLDLPPKMRVTEYVELSDKQRQLYNEIKMMIEANLDEISLNPNPLTELLRLRQATAHTAILSETIRESAKFERLAELLEDIADSGQKAVIFSNWTSVTDIVYREFAKKYNAAIVTGATKNREAEIDRFQNDANCKIIIGTIGALGIGFTLTASNNVIFLDKPWSMADVEQAEDRCHRIGTVGTTTIITLVARNTVDERIEELLEEKADIASALVDGNFARLSKRGLLERLIR